MIVVQEPEPIAADDARGPGDEVPAGRVNAPPPVADRRVRDEPDHIVAVHTPFESRRMFV